MPTHEEDWTEWCWVELDANASLDWEKQDDGTEELIISVRVGCFVGSVCFSRARTTDALDPYRRKAITGTSLQSSICLVGGPTRQTTCISLILRSRICERCKRATTSTLVDFRPLTVIPSVGRKDDVIVHSTGEKTVPIPIEGLILTSPLFAVGLPGGRALADNFYSVAAAVMFGRGKDEAGILIEPSSEHRIDVKDDVQVAAVRNAIWWVPKASAGLMMLTKP